MTIQNIRAWSAAIVALAILFFVTTKLIATDGAAHIPWTKEQLQALLIWAGAGVSAAIALTLFTWRAIGFFSFTIAMLAICSGIVNIALVMLTLLSCYCIGQPLLSKSITIETNSNCSLVSTLLGLSLLTGVLGAMLHFPVNYPSVYITLLLTPIILKFRHQDQRLAFWLTLTTSARQFNQQLEKLNYPLFCLALTLSSFVASFLLLPTTMLDDNTLHLAVWSQITYHHQYHFNTELQKWSVAPFLLDSLHAFISSISNMDARPAINLTLWTLLLGFIWQLLRLANKQPNLSLISLMLFASTPMIANLMMGLQTELLLATLTTCGVWLLGKQEPPNSRLVGILIVCCLLTATKLPAVLIALSLFLGVLLFHWRELRELITVKSAFSVLLIFLISAGVVLSALQSYLVAYSTTGNPIYPLYDNLFNPDSPIRGLSGSPFIKTPGLDSYLGFFFDSSNYFESADFIAGFQYCFLPLVGVFLLIWNKQYRLAIALMLPIFIFGTVIFLQMQYWRYLFPLLPLASVLMAAIYSNSQHLTQVITGFIFAVYTGMNMLYLPGISHMFYENHLTNIFATENQKFTDTHIPEVSLNNYINKHYGAPNVLFAIKRPLGATLWGTPIYVGRMAPGRFEKLKSINSEEEMLGYLIRERIYLFYIDESYTDTQYLFVGFLKQIANKDAIKERALGNISLYHLKSSPLLRRGNDD